MSEPFLPMKTAELLWRNGLPYSLQFDDIYFAKEGGLLEALHVFILGNELPKRWQALKESQFVIAETGFGSGLNFLLAWVYWLEHAPVNAKLYFISCEQFPLAKTDLEQCLRLWPQLHEKAQCLLNDYPVLTPGFHHLVFEAGRVNLILMLGEATASYNQLLVCKETSLEGKLRCFAVDAWFLDGFSPVKNPEMWSEDLFFTLALLSKPTTSLATFSAAKVVKDNLKALGFAVVKQKGFGQKRDMLTASFKNLKSIAKPSSCLTPWHQGYAHPIPDKKAIVLGAGLAGCYLSSALAKRGWQVSLLDGQAELAAKASANPQAVLYPHLSAHHSPFADFLLSAFLFASRCYKKYLAQVPIGNLSGILEFNIQKKKRLSRLLLSYPELGVFVDAEEASRRAGIQITADALFIPKAGWLNVPALCHFLIQHASISWNPNTVINELIYEDGLWQVNGHAAPFLILANGYAATQFAQTQSLNLQPVSGQLTYITSNPDSDKLKLPLCGSVYVAPALQGRHTLGASFYPGIIRDEPDVTDDKINLDCLAELPSSLNWSFATSGSFAGVRAVSKDYLPLVGQVPEVHPFKQRFKLLQADAKRWLPFPGCFYPGLYILAGFGSRGLCTIPLAAEWLAGFINHEPPILPRQLIQALSPARFVRDEIIKPIT